MHEAARARTEERRALEAAKSSSGATQATEAKETEPADDSSVVQVGRRTANGVDGEAEGSDNDVEEMSDTMRVMNRTAVSHSDADSGDRKPEFLKIFERQEVQVPVRRRSEDKGEAW